MAMNTKGRKENMQQISKLLTKVFVESQGNGQTQAELIERFELRLAELEVEEKRTTARKSAKKSKAKTSTKRAKVQKSKSNVKVKTTGKMKDSAKIRERLS